MLTSDRYNYTLEKKKKNRTYYTIIIICHFAVYRYITLLVSAGDLVNAKLTHIYQTFNKSLTIWSHIYYYCFYALPVTTTLRRKLIVYLRTFSAKPLGEYNS